MAARATKRRRRRPPASRRSRIALDAVNFFLAGLTGIGSPYLSDLLRDRGWSFGAIGVGAAMSGLGVSLFQPLTGYLLDHARRPRLVLAASSVGVGICYAALPSLASGPQAIALAVLFASGIPQSIFGPLLPGLALGLVGHNKLDRTMGENQAWSCLGNVAAALVSLAIIGAGIEYVFFLVGIVGLLGAAAAFLIRGDEINLDRATGGRSHVVPFRTLLEDRNVLILLVCTALFQAAYASAFPFVVLRVRSLGGGNTIVAVMVLVTQASMTPVAFAAGRLLEKWGHKPVFAIGFLTLPVYVLACGLVRNVPVLVGLQVLGSIGPGILAVALVVVCADLTQGKGRFHALTGATRTAMAGGSVAGPLATGFLVGHVGYGIAFAVLTVVAAAAALLFVFEMPETGATKDRMGAD